MWWIMTCKFAFTRTCVSLASGGWFAQASCYCHLVFYTCHQFVSLPFSQLNDGWLASGEYHSHTRHCSSLGLLQQIFLASLFARRCPLEATGLGRCEQWLDLGIFFNSFISSQTRTIKKTCETREKEDFGFKLEHALYVEALHILSFLTTFSADSPHADLFSECKDLELYCTACSLRP